VNAPPAAKADGASLALALADALSLGLPDPGYITMHPSLAGSTTSSAIDFQFNGYRGRDPLPDLRAWAGRFGATIRVETYDDPSKAWHKFEFTHAGAMFGAYASVAAASPAIDSEAWKCAGCGAQCIAGRPAGDLCRDCAGRVLAASIASGQPVTVADDAPQTATPMDDGETCTCGQPLAAHPLDITRGFVEGYFCPEPPDPSGDDPEPGSQAYADKYASRTVQHGLLDGGQLPRRVVSLDSRMGFVSRLDGAKVRTGGEL
jgi:hypothetical protein